MILVIDNYDSFTYNLVHFLGELGARLVVKRNDKITLDEIGADPAHLPPVEDGARHRAFRHMDDGNDDGRLARLR